MKSLGRGRKGASGVPRRPHRSASNLSSSSTSSDILVAPGPPTTTPKPPSAHVSPVPAAMAKGIVLAQVRDKHLLVVRVTGGKNRGFLNELAEADARKEKQQDLDAITNHIVGGANVKDEANEDDGDGPNRRGTYSKAYVLQHPEIKWVHRGQGRYLPAPRGRPSNLFRSQS